MSLIFFINFSLLILFAYNISKCLLYVRKTSMKMVGVTSAFVVSVMALVNLIFSIQFLTM